MGRNLCWREEGVKDGEKEHTTVSSSVTPDVYIKRNKQSPDRSSKSKLGVYYEEKVCKDGG